MTDPINLPAAWLHPMTIGSVTLPNNLALAPMAGSTDITYRPICRAMGAGLTVTELVSARGICHDPGLHRNERYLMIDPERENPVAIQLFGSDPADFSQSVSTILAHPILSQCAMIDINMGCPVPKVVRGGEGSALMRTPELAAAIIQATVRAAGSKPVTVKFRKGWDDESVNAVEFARLCAAAGAAALTIHARTRSQFYSGRADWSIIKAVKAAVQVPVFGNGDVVDAVSARRLLAETGVDGIMIGRAALGNPWLFRQLTCELANPPRPYIPPTPEERLAVMLAHLDGLVARLGERTGVHEMRKQLVAYLRGTRQAAHWKNMAMQADNRDDVQVVLEDWCNNVLKNSENIV
jgi:tRNA-dihydrouridine synthase B